MMNKLRNPNSIFILFWLALQLVLNWQSYIQLPPYGMHQGAQCDRACIALNYYQESANFFEPRVMENRGFEGVTGLEFPMTQYIVAALYKVFGFHHFIYRLVMGVFAFMACFFAFQITRFFVKKLLTRILLITIWYASPIFTFYAFGFLPDIPALAFVMMGWYFFIRYHYGIEPEKSFRNFMISTAFAGLFKITFLINAIAVVGLYFLHKYRKISLENPIKLTWKQRFWILLPLASITIWYVYANYLTKLTWNFHFMQKANPAHSLREFLDNSQYSWNSWADSIYPKTTLLLLVIIGIFTIIRNRQKIELLGAITLLLFGGFLVVFTLFNGQYRYHDYYFIIGYPFVFFLILYLQQTFVENQIVIMGLSGILSLVGLYVLPFSNMAHAKNQLRRTFTQNDYYCQAVFPRTQDLISVKQWIDQKEPNAKTEIIVAFDNTPNTALYLIQRQGIRIASDFDSTLIRDVIRHKFEITPNTATWILCNNPQELQKKWPKLSANFKYSLSTTPIYYYGEWSILPITYSK